MRSAVKLREEFVVRALGKVQPFAELCRDFAISRKTGYKWVKRFDSKGLGGLGDESRRPDSSPSRMSVEVEEVIAGLRREFPKWGPKKIRAVLARRQPALTAPSEGTIARILRERGFVTHRQRHVSAGPPVRPPRLDPLEANDLWTVDFKGWWRAHDRSRCEPLTVRDAVSRFVLRAKLLTSTKTEDVQPVFLRIFEEYGLPKTIQTDNGPPFASRRGIGGLSRLSAWWVSLGIFVVRSRPGCPQDNGGHERMHRDMVPLAHVSAPTVPAQQQLIDEWVVQFNFIRPHEALGMGTPGDSYRPSRRRHGDFCVGGFPDDCDLVPVNRCMAKWKGHRIHIGAAFNGFPVGFRRLDDGRSEAWFFRVRLGTFLLGERGSFEVDAELIAPPPRRASESSHPNAALRGLMYEVAVAHVSRGYSVVERMLRRHASELGAALLRTRVERLGSAEGAGAAKSLDAGAPSATGARASDLRTALGAWRSRMT